MAADDTRVTHAAPKPAPVRVGQGSCLIVVEGPGLGRRYELGQALSVGRDPDNDVVLAEEVVSRRHARFSVHDERAWVEDLGSANGTWVEDERVGPPRALASGERVHVGHATLKFLAGDDLEAQYHDALYALAVSDPLTGAYNRRYLTDFLEREVRRCARYARPLSLVLWDVDHFKRVNDAHGHPAGDGVLRELARRVRALVRGEQCFARYGGEEFALVVPESGPEGARLLAERIRQAVAQTPVALEAGGPLAVTVSLGVADLGPDVRDAGALLAAADARLYAAKQAGRNRVAG